MFPEGCDYKTECGPRPNVSIAEHETKWNVELSSDDVKKDHPSKRTPVKETHSSDAGQGNYSQFSSQISVQSLLKSLKRRRPVVLLERIDLSPTGSYVLPKISSDDNKKSNLRAPGFSYSLRISSNKRRRIDFTSTGTSSILKKSSAGDKSVGVVPLKTFHTLRSSSKDHKKLNVSISGASFVSKNSPKKNKRNRKTTAKGSLKPKNSSGSRKRTDGATVGSSPRPHSSFEESEKIVVTTLEAFTQHEIFCNGLGNIDVDVETCSSSENLSDKEDEMDNLSALMGVNSSSEGEKVEVSTVETTNIFKNSTIKQERSDVPMSESSLTPENLLTEQERMNVLTNESFAISKNPSLESEKGKVSTAETSLLLTNSPIKHERQDVKTSETSLAPNNSFLQQEKTNVPAIESSANLENLWKEQDKIDNLTGETSLLLTNSPIKHERQDITISVTSPMPKYSFLQQEENASTIDSSSNCENSSKEQDESYDFTRETMLVLTNSPIKHEVQDFSTSETFTPKNSSMRQERMNVSTTIFSDCVNSLKKQDEVDFSTIETSPVLTKSPVKQEKQDVTTEALLRSENSNNEQGIGNVLISGTSCTLENSFNEQNQVDIVATESSQITANLPVKQERLDDATCEPLFLPENSPLKQEDIDIMSTATSSTPDTSNKKAELASISTSSTSLLPHNLFHRQDAILVPQEVSFTPKNSSCSQGDDAISSEATKTSPVGQERRDIVKSEAPFLPKNSSVKQEKKIDVTAETLVLPPGLNFSFKHDPINIMTLETSPSSKKSSNEPKGIDVTTSEKSPILVDSCGELLRISKTELETPSMPESQSKGLLGADVTNLETPPLPKNSPIKQERIDVPLIVSSDVTTSENSAPPNNFSNKQERSNVPPLIITSRLTDNTSNGQDIIYVTRGVSLLSKSPSREQIKVNGPPNGTILSPETSNNQPEITQYLKETAASRKLCNLTLTNSSGRLGRTDLAIDVPSLVPANLLSRQKITVSSEEIPKNSSVGTDHSTITPVRNFFAAKSLLDKQRITSLKTSGVLTVPSDSSIGQETTPGVEKETTNNSDRKKRIGMFMPTSNVFQTKSLPDAGTSETLTLPSLQPKEVPFVQGGVTILPKKSSDGEEIVDHLPRRRFLMTKNLSNQRKRKYVATPGISSSSKIKEKVISVRKEVPILPKNVSEGTDGVNFIPMRRFLLTKSISDQLERLNFRKAGTPFSSKNPSIEQGVYYNTQGVPILLEKPSHEKKTVKVLPDRTDLSSKTVSNEQERYTKTTGSTLSSNSLPNVLERIVAPKMEAPSMAQDSININSKQPERSQYDMGMVIKSDLSSDMSNNGCIFTDEQADDEDDFVITGYDTASGTWAEERITSSDSGSNSSLDYNSDKGTEEASSKKNDQSVAVVEKNFCCPYCPAKYALKRCLQEHMRSFPSSDHSPGNKIRKYVCEICQHKCLTKRCLRTHYLYQHSDVADHCCPHCSKCYKTMYALKSHLISHEPPSYSCDLCNARFRMRSSWKRHVRTHVQNEPYACPYCPARYKNKGDLLEHSKCFPDNNHTQANRLKRFQCRSCLFSAVCRSVLHAHIRENHKETLFQCAFCTKVFSLRKNLDIHLLRHDEKPVSTDPSREIKKPARDKVSSRVDNLIGFFKEPKSSESTKSHKDEHLNRLLDNQEGPSKQQFSQAFCPPSSGLKKLPEIRQREHPNETVSDDLCPDELEETYSQEHEHLLKMAQEKIFSRADCPSVVVCKPGLYKYLKGLTNEQLKQFVQIKEKQ